MKNKILGKLFGKSEAVSYSFEELLNSVTRIRKGFDYICIVPQPTAGNWLGINNASKQLFSDAVFEMPQYYSNQVLTDEEILLLVKHIQQLAYSNVVFSGFPAYFEKIVSAFSTDYTDKLGVILHGTFTEMGNSPAAAAAMITPVNLLRERKIGKLATVRKSAAEFINANWGLRVFELANKSTLQGVTLGDRAEREGINIGVLGASTFNKNLHNQVCAAVLVEGAKVHVSSGNNFDYLGSGKLLEHSRLNRNEFITLLSQMDVNLHLSFSESWGQVAAESMLAGVPCLVSANTNLLDGNTYLKQELTVNRTDAPLEIAAHIERVLANADELSLKGRIYMEQLNEKADVLLAQFLQA